VGRAPAVSIGPKIQRVRLRSFLYTACAAVAIASVLPGSAFAGVPGFGAAKAFHRYPVYWAGSEVLGMPLEDIEGHAGYEKQAPSGWSFLYGTCELSGTDHPSCAPPLQIQIDSTCKRWASELNKLKDVVPFRGAKAVWHPGIPLEGGGEGESGPLEIFTGRATVVIFVEPYGLKTTYHLNDPEKVAFEAAEALRTVHQASPKPLPPPAPGSLAGKLACQKTPTE
jgi:hypothetical protein